MSVLLEYAMFPTDKGESVSTFVSKIVDMVKDSGFPYKLTAMGTIVETDNISQATEIINKSYAIIEPFAERVYATMTMDIRKNKSGRITDKVKSVEDIIGEVNK